MTPCKLAIGDRITFKACTRSSYVKATRRVTGIDPLGRPQVRYHGWGKFIVAWHEVLAVHRAEGGAA